MLMLNLIFLSLVKIFTYIDLSMLTIKNISIYTNLNKTGNPASRLQLFYLISFFPNSHYRNKIYFSACLDVR